MLLPGVTCPSVFIDAGSGESGALTPPKSSAVGEMAKSHLQLKRYYSHYNRKHFNSELPTDTVLVWEPTTKDRTAETELLPDGRFKIRLCPSISGLPRVAKTDLLHEMCHVKRGLLGNITAFCSHGKAFKAEIRRLLEAGAFDELL